MAEILKPTDENLRILRKFLRLGGLVAVPTETVYGLAANALDADACAKIFEAKERPSNDPLICHVASYEALDAFCETNEASKILAADLCSAQERHDPRHCHRRLGFRRSP